MARLLDKHALALGRRLVARHTHGAQPTVVPEAGRLKSSHLVYGVERGLWPRTGTPEHLQALSWCAWAYVTYGAMLVRLQVATQGGEALKHEPSAQAAHQGLDQLLALLDQRLAIHPWMLGEHYSMVDLLVASVIGYSAYLGAPVDRHPSVQAWLGRVQARPAMQIEA